MNKKDLGDIRRRMSKEKSNAKKIYGCYVNVSKEIIYTIEETFGFMPELDEEKYFGLFKKSLSGTLGKNLVNLEFTTAQVVDSDEHRLLMRLRKSELEDAEAREEFFKKVIDSFEIEGANYVILLTHEKFDVIYKSKDDMAQEDASDKVFSYIICAVCPVKEGKTELSYSFERKFHGLEAKEVVAPPEVGFMFPAYEEGSANIYTSLLYSKSSELPYSRFITEMFNTEIPMSADEQKDIFHNVLTESLEQDCNLDVVQYVHEQIREKVEQHKESKDPEILDISVKAVGEILENSGVEEGKVEKFVTRCEEEFGEGASLNPVNILDTKKFEVITPQVKISIDPEYSGIVETTVVNGKKFLLIPIEDGMEINGYGVHTKVEETV